MRNLMNHSTIVALAFAIGATGLTFGGAANAADACAGQSYPNWSEACKQQKLDKLANSMVVKEKPKSRAPVASYKSN